MKKFVYKILCFGSILFLIIATLVSYKSFLYRNFSFKIPEKKHVLFMGASLLETSINDNLINSGINLCMSAEPHLYTYLKLKYLLRDNSQIDTIFLGLSPSNLYENTDNRYFNENQAPFFIYLYYPLFSYEEYSHLFKMNTFRCLEFLLKSIGHHYYFSGEKYLNQFGSFTKSLQKIDLNQKQNWKEVDNNEGNKINLLYLKKINDLCSQYGINLYYVYTPMYKKDGIPHERYFYQTYSSQFAEIPLLDYSNWSIPDSCRQDVFHLNYYGSILFTNEIKHRFNLE